MCDCIQTLSDVGILHISKPSKQAEFCVLCLQNTSTREAMNESTKRRFDVITHEENIMSTPTFDSLSSDQQTLMNWPRFSETADSNNSETAT